MTRRISVRAKTGAKNEGVEVIPDGTVIVRTTARREKGRANEAIVDLLAEHYGIPKSLVRLVSGSTSAKKIFEIPA